MFGMSRSESAISRSTLKALDRSLAVIEFNPDGHILAANPNFCKAVGYEADEIIGRHHRMFVEPAYAETSDYRVFWDNLRAGRFHASEYKRLGKGGRVIWIHATYNPVFDAKGRVRKIIKFASDITSEKEKSSEFESKLNAVSRSQAVIEFTPTGQILTANENFTATVGYRLEEIVGRHHSMFVDPAYAASKEYADFWVKLASGEFVSSLARRVGKGGRKILLQASYNPVFDMSGKVTKVVKFASEITELDQIADGLSRLADRDLAVRLPNPLSPAFEKVRTDFNTTATSLGNAIGLIKASTDTVASSASEIASMSDELSRRAEQQAASLEQTSAALDQINNTVRKTAQGAKHATGTVAKARQDAEVSGDVVRDAIEAMGRIQKSSQQIASIINLIDEIAFQTNLLALNAGVEAARAGDTGRGFAVVAQEVRALAQRSANAAKEIKDLISTSHTEVESGVRLVAKTGETLNLIVERVGEIDSVVADIAAGAADQATALNEVNIAVNQMDLVTQQNAAMAQEATAAGQTLSLEAGRLADEVANFKLVGTKVSDLRRHLGASAPQVLQRAS
jgi:methyl-accepting chemotaxis protein